MPCCCCLPILLASIGVAAYLYSKGTFHQSFELQTASGEGYFTTKLKRMSSVEQAYRVDVVIGENKTVPVTSLIDTGSHKTWVSKSQTDKTDSSMVESDNTFQVNYMGGSVSGDIGVETLTMGNMSWRQPLGFMINNTMNSDDFQSLIGLSRMCSDIRCTPDHWNISNKQFGFYYDPSTSEGLMHAGWSDITKCADRYTIVGLLHAQDAATPFWTIPVNFRGRENVSAVIDTGTTFIYLKKNIYDSFIQPGMENSCDQSKLPSFEIGIGSGTFGIHPSKYIRKTGLRTCSLRIGVLDERFPEDMLLGATFLSEHYFVLDSSANMLGICRPVSSHISKLRSICRQAFQAAREIAATVSEALS